VTLIAGGRLPRRWRPAWSQTIRFRLTVAYSSLLFGLAALVVGGVYVGVATTVDAQPLRVIEVQEGYRLPNGKVVTRGDGFEAAELSTVQDAVNLQTLRTLRTYSIGALGGLFLASLGIGWWLSGRVLRPVRRITATARDITATDLSRRIDLDGPQDELRALADTVDDMLARLDREFAAQRQLVDDASHELRNPLAIIQANLDAVLTQDDVDDEQRRHATEVVGRATARMTRLVEDLLATTRRDSSAFAESNVDLAAVAGEAADEYALLAEERGIRLRRRLAPGPVVIGDPTALRRAVDNLLSNAVRLAPGRSEIVVAVGSREGWSWVAVRDEGPGIAPADQVRVFDRFYRAAPGDGTRANGGPGLGLAIVRQVVESHGGAVTLHSVPGRGSTFVLWLPDRAGLGDHDNRRRPRPPEFDPLARTAAAP
jgi:signal transduction histidine kinase